MIMRLDKPLLPPVLLVALFVAKASGAEWSTSAGVAPAVTYTDNVCLSSENEKGEWVGLVTPSGSITGNGNKANISLSGSVELNTLSDSDLEGRGCGNSGTSDRKQFAPNIGASADAVLVEDWLFIDARGRAQQNDVSSFASGGNDSLDRTGNTNTTYSYTVSPYIKRRFKNTADLTLRYTYDDQYNSKDVVGDSSEESAELLFTGGPMFSPFSWSLQGDYSKVDYSDTPGRDVNNDSELKSAQFNLGYQLNRAWQVNGYYGQEWNDFISSEDDIDGDFWDVGLRWTPTSRTTVDVGTGDRFYGSTPRFSINHRHKRSVLTASYSEELTYDRNIRTLDDPLSGGVGTGVDGQSPLTSGNATILSNSPLLDQRFTLGYAYQGRRSSLRVTGSYSDQTRATRSEETIIRDATFKSVAMSVTRTLSRKLSVSGGISWEESEPNESSEGIVDSAETWLLSAGAERRLGQNMALSFDYQFTDRQSGNNDTSGNLFGDYTENRFTLTLRISL